MDRQSNYSTLIERGILTPGEHEIIQKLKIKYIKADRKNTHFN